MRDQCARRDARGEIWFYIGGSAIIGGRLEIGSVIQRLFNDEKVISVTVVLPPDLPFEMQTILDNQINEAGGAATTRTRTETFEQIIDQRLQRNLATTSEIEPVEEKIASPGALTDDARKLVES